MTKNCSSNRITKKSMASLPANSNRMPTVTYNESMANEINACHFTHDFVSGPINSGSAYTGTLQLWSLPVCPAPAIYLRLHCTSFADSIYSIQYIFPLCLLKNSVPYYKIYP